jgi:hypothetical protein
MTDEQRNPGDERRQPFPSHFGPARMEAMIRRCVDMIGHGKGATATSPKGPEGEEADASEHPCSCR